MSRVERIPRDLDGDCVVRLDNVTKSFLLFRTRQYQTLHALGLRRLALERGLIGTVDALIDVDLSVRAGEQVGLIGHNGSGKTTLLNLITGKLEPSSGLLQASEDVQALMSAEGNTIDELSGMECIRSALVLNGLTKSEEREAFEDILDFVELGEFIEHPVRTYSLGMRARLEFAIATAIRPRVLVIDEVLGAGDGYFARKSAQRMRDLTSRTTLLLVSHSMRQILDYCERAVWLNNGRIEEDGPAEAVCKAYERFMVARESQHRTEAEAAINRQPSIAETTTRGLPVELELGAEAAARRSHELFPVESAQQLEQPQLLGVGFGPQQAQSLTSETGEPLSIGLDVRVPPGYSGLLNASVFGLSPSGDLVWECRGLSLDVTSGDHRFALETPRIIAGVGSYFITVVLEDRRGSAHSCIAAHHAALFLRLSTTNYADAPLVHCPARWRYGTRNEREDSGRVSAWV